LKFHTSADIALILPLPIAFITQKIATHSHFPWLYIADNDNETRNPAISKAEDIYHPISVGQKMPKNSKKTLENITNTNPTVERVNTVYRDSQKWCFMR
jgi:hypothetical protein